MSSATLTRRTARAASLASAALVAALAASGTVGTTPSASPSWQLAYERYDAGIGQSGIGIDVVTSSQLRPRSIGRERRRSDYYGRPKWSPDGKYLAFQARIGASFGLYVVRADGSRSTRVARGPTNDDFLWSRDGRRLAFVSRCDLFSPSDGAAECASGRIDVVLRDGTRRRVVVRPTAGRARSWIQLADWSPDGTRLLALITIAGRERLVSVDVRRGSSRTLADSRAEGDLGLASWSSDGSLIAYTRQCREFRDVFCAVVVMTPSGEAKRVLVSADPPTGPSDDAPVWLPGSSLLVVPVWGSPANTLRVDARTGRTTTIADTPWWNPVAGRDGRTIARLERSFVGSEVVILARPDGSTVGRSRLPKVPSRQILSTSDHDLWIP